MLAKLIPVARQVNGLGENSIQDGMFKQSTYKKFQKQREQGFLEELQCD